jgi:hypothetical protein
VMDSFSLAALALIAIIWKIRVADADRLPLPAVSSATGPDPAAPSQAASTAAG